jgi:hypothetical protein
MTGPALDRSLLLGEKKDDLLTLAEVERYGSENCGDPDYLSLYGLRPAGWYARGVRIAGRTAVECTRDLLADLMILRFCARTLGTRPMLVAVQVADQIQQDSLAEVTALLDWSALTMYDINAPGHKAGVLLGTIGWNPR